LDGAFGDVSDPQKKWLKKINHHSLRLHEMISDILDLSKLQSGKAEMRRESLDLGKLIKTTVANLQTLVKEKKLSLRHRMPAELPHIWADPSRLEQVLTNLITNAIKFTPVEGRVEVSALPEDNHLIVSVSDTGPGIAPEYRDVIFDRFRQVRDSDKQESSTQGIGLGLAICKEIVAQHHGHIWVESELGKGSQFMFQLPIDARDSHQQVKNILVVDDDEEIGELLEVTLTQAGYLVTVLRNGKQAIQCLQDKNKHFDVVFLDLMLPGASGAEVIKVIRQMKMSCEIAVVTAYPNSEMLFEGMATGPLTIIAKPFNTESILDIAAKARPAPSASVPKSRAA
jgi:CheY-like chemotaxis protein